MREARLWSPHRYDARVFGGLIAIGFVVNLMLGQVSLETSWTAAFVPGPMTMHINFWILAVPIALSALEAAISPAARPGKWALGSAAALASAVLIRVAAGDEWGELLLWLLVPAVPLVATLAAIGAVIGRALHHALVLNWPTEDER